MKLKFIALNALLLIGVLAIAWQARARWEEAQKRRAANLNAAVKPVASLPTTPLPKPEAPPAAKYADVATKDLFAKDRNPVVIVETPKVEPAKPMPPLPVVYGVLALPSGTKAIMAEKTGGPSTPVHQGDTVGEFTIVSLDPRNVTFEWNGQEISRKIDDLIDRSGPVDNTGRGNGPAVVLQPNSQARNTVQTNNINPGSPSLGAETGSAGASQRACVPGDNSPPGTVVDGYKKVVTASPFGSICRWKAN